MDVIPALGSHGEAGPAAEANDSDRDCVAGDMFAYGLVKNLAHPEGNITGVTNY